MEEKLAFEDSKDEVRKFILCLDLKLTQGPDSLFFTA